MSRACPVVEISLKVPLTGGRIGRKVVSSTLSRGHQIVSGGRPANVLRRAVKARSVQLPIAADICFGLASRNRWTTFPLGRQIEIRERQLEFGDDSNAHYRGDSGHLDLSRHSPNRFQREIVGLADGARSATTLLSNHSNTRSRCRRHHHDLRRVRTAFPPIHLTGQ